MNKKVRRPSGPFPSLPSGMDNILKVHFDKHRKDDTIPEELAGKFEGRLFRDVGKLDVWRNNFRGLRYLDEKSGITLTGALDDLFVTSDGKYAPLDFKTRGFPRKEDTHKHYQHQMDLYSFLLEKNSMDPANYAILIFYHPLNVEDDHNVVFNADTGAQAEAPRIDDGADSQENRDAQGGGERDGVERLNESSPLHGH